MWNHWHKYNLYDRTLRKLSLLLGLWPKPNPSVWYRLLALVHGLGTVIMCVAISAFCYHNLTTLNGFMKGFSLALSYVTMIQKTICFACYRKRLVQLHATLAITFGQDLDDTKLRPILLSPLPSFYHPSLTLSTMTYMVLILHVITPIIVIIIQLFRGVDTIKYLLPLPAIYPWEIYGGSWLYLAHYAFETYASMCLVSFTSFIDSLFGYYIFQISGQLRTLSHRMYTMRSTENYRKVIRECVIRHQTLTRCHRHLEKIYGPIVIWMLAMSALTICALIYQGSKMPPGKAVIIVVYIAMKSVQALVYGSFGTFLTNEVFRCGILNLWTSDAFREAIYASDWPGSGEKCLMTDILIMMTYKPIVLTACSLSTISVDMFIAVLNTAVSYFFMLRTLEEKNTA